MIADYGTSLQSCLDELALQDLPPFVLVQGYIFEGLCAQFSCSLLTETFSAPMQKIVLYIDQQHQEAPEEMPLP